MSSDRLFRVRNKQPNTNQRIEPTQSLDVDAPLPVVCSSIKVGGICIFKSTEARHVDKVLQFKFTQARTIKSQQYQGISTKVEPAGLSVLCLCYTSNSTNILNLTFIWPIYMYLCTLYFSCFHSILIFRQLNCSKGKK